MITDFYCVACKVQCATYDGDLRETNTVLAEKFHFVDGSQPKAGEHAMWKCPGCHKMLFLVSHSVRAEIRKPKVLK